MHKLGPGKEASDEELSGGLVRTKAGSKSWYGWSSNDCHCIDVRAYKGSA